MAGGPLNENDFGIGGVFYEGNLNVCRRLRVFWALGGRGGRGEKVRGRKGKERERELTDIHVG